MRFRIADTFTASLVKLSNDQQRARGTVSVFNGPNPTVWGTPRGAAGLCVKSVPREARGERTLKGFGVSLDPGSIPAPFNA